MPGLCCQRSAFRMCSLASRLRLPAKGRYAALNEMWLTSALLLAAPAGNCPET
jgi:hypothetical protein